METANCKAKRAQVHCTKELYVQSSLYSGEELARVNKFFGSLPTEAAHMGHIVEAKEDSSLNRCISSLLKW